MEVSFNFVIFAPKNRGVSEFRLTQTVSQHFSSKPEEPSMKIKPFLTVLLLLLTFTGHTQRPVGVDPVEVKKVGYEKLMKTFEKIFDSVKSRIGECGVKTQIRLRTVRDKRTKFGLMYKILSDLHLKEGVKMPGDPKDPCPETKQLHCLISNVQEDLNEFTEDKEVKEFLRTQFQVKEEKLGEILDTLRMINPSYKGNQLQDG